VVCDFGGFGGGGIGGFVVGVVGGGGHDDGAIAKQAHGPDKFEEPIGEENHEEEDFDLPDYFRGDGGVGKVAGEHGQLVCPAQQRDTPADGDHAGRGEEGCSLAHDGEDGGVENARLAGDHLHHPAFAVGFHQHVGGWVFGVLTFNYRGAAETSENECADTKGVEQGEMDEDLWQQCVHRAGLTQGVGAVRP